MTEMNTKDLSENMQKYYIYKEQMERLTKALNAHFYLEAVFIEYAIMEDRLQSFLMAAGVYNEKKHWQITGKIKGLKKLLAEEEHPLGRYLTEEQLDQITAWKDKRNPLIHALMKQSMTTESLAELAEEGRKIAKVLNSKTTSYRRYMERQAEKK